MQAQRLAGFRIALEAAGITDNDGFRAVPYTIPGGYAGALAVLADPGSRPTAIVAGCDEIAIGAIIAAAQLGIQVPAQLSVVGIDGHNLADMFGLTTLEQHPSLQGSRAVDLIMERLAAEPVVLEDERITMPVTLNVRRSTTAPPTQEGAAP